jgi:type II secretory pathway pseudopilin PulG
MIDMRHRNLKRYLAGDGGFVLPTAIIVLLIITVLIGAAVTVASQTSRSTTRDDNSKAALEAAEAGLGVATYRLIKLQPEKAQCITGEAKATPPVSGYCEDTAPEKLGNQAEFTYWTTQDLSYSGQACVGPTVTLPAGFEGTQRCVTAVGTVNGIKRRIEERVFSNISSPLFEVNGILGYSSVFIKQNGKLEGAIGTNGTINLENGVTVTETVLGPNGKVEGSGAPGTTTKTSTEFVRPQIPIGQSAVSATTKTECGKPTLGEPAGKNCDVLITNGINKNKPGEEDPSSGTTFNSSTRSLSMGNGATLLLNEGIYNFCDFRAGTNGTLKIAANAVSPNVQIFIDSANREKPGEESHCKADPEAGKVAFQPGFAIENPNTNATSLQIYVYDGSGGTIKFENNSSSAFYGTIIAPYSKIEFKSNGEFVGGIEANEVALNNNFKFKWEAKAKDLKKEEKPRYQRKTWSECPPTYTGTNPQAGC